MNLNSVNTDSLTVVGKSKEEERLDINRFSIIVNNVTEAINKRLPVENCVIVREKAVFCEQLSVSNEQVLKTIKEIVHDINGVSDIEMISNSHNGKKKYNEPRQLIMATYYSTLYGSGVTLEDSAALYGKNHATVLNAIKNVQNGIDTDRMYNLKYMKLWEFIHAINPNNRIRVRL